MMSGDPTSATRQEERVARRLARLFRIERAGRHERWRRETVQGLLARRAALIDELLSLDKTRRAREPLATGELDFAMRALAHDVDSTERHCLERLAELGSELQRRRGGGPPTGLRGGVGGRVLGRV